MPYELCRHIRTSGHRCHSPAIRDSFWCFYHAKLHSRHRDIRSAANTPCPIHLPALEDHDAIQVALSLTVNALGTGALDEKRARAILLGLNIALRNVDDITSPPESETLVTSSSPTLDGLPLATRVMSDNSTPPPYPHPAAPEK